jgi:endonuclease G
MGKEGITPVGKVAPPAKPEPAPPPADRKVTPAATAVRPGLLLSFDIPVDPDSPGDPGSLKAAGAPNNAHATVKWNDPAHPRLHSLAWFTEGEGSKLLDAMSARKRATGGGVIVLADPPDAERTDSEGRMMSDWQRALQEAGVSGKPKGPAVLQDLAWPGAPPLDFSNPSGAGQSGLSLFLPPSSAPADPFNLFPKQPPVLMLGPLPIKSDTEWQAEQDAKRVSALATFHARVRQLANAYAAMQAKAIMLGIATDRTTPDQVIKEAEAAWQKFKTDNPQAAPEVGFREAYNFLRTKFSGCYGNIVREYKSLGIDLPSAEPEQVVQALESIGDQSRITALRIQAGKAEIPPEWKVDDNAKYQLEWIDGREVWVLKSTTNKALAETLRAERDSLLIVEQKVGQCSALVAKFNDNEPWFVDHKPPRPDAIVQQLHVIKKALAEGDLPAYHAEIAKLQPLLRKFDKDMRAYCDEVNKASAQIREYEKYITYGLMAAGIAVSALTAGAASPAVVALGEAINTGLVVTTVAVSAGAEITIAKMNGDDIDWGHIAIQAACAYISARAGGPVSDAIMLRLLKIPALSQLDAQLLKGIATNLTLGTGLRTVGGLEAVVKRAQEKAAGSGRRLTFSEFSDIVAEEMINAVGDPESIGIDVFVGVAHGAIGAKVAAKKPSSASASPREQPAPSTTVVQRPAPAAPQSKTGEVPAAPAPAIPADPKSVRSVAASRQGLLADAQGRVSNAKTEPEVEAAEREAAYVREQAAAWANFADAKDAFEAAVAAGHSPAEVAALNTKQIAAYGKARAADHLSNVASAASSSPIIHSMQALDVLAETKRGVSDNAQARLKAATAARDSARAALDAATKSPAGKDLEGLGKSLTKAETDLKAAEYDAAYFKEAAKAWTEFAQAKKVVAEIEKATKKPLPENDPRKVKERATFAAAWQADHGAGAPVPAVEDFVDLRPVAARPVSGGQTASATADTVVQGRPKMLRPQSVVLLSPDLADIAAKLQLPAHLQDATVIVGHGRPGRLADMEREKAVAFASTQAKPGKPIIFVSCSLADDMPTGTTPRPTIPTSMAGTGKVPYVVAYSELVTVLPYDVPGFPKGSIVPIKERPDIPPAIQQGPVPDQVPPGKTVRQLGDGQYVLCDENIIPIQKPISPEDRDSPAIVRRPDGTYVKVVMHEVVPTESARKVILPVVGNWATDQANTAYREAKAATEYAHDHPQVADVYNALAKFHQAKARWYEASRDNPASASLDEVKQAYAQLLAKYKDFGLAAMRSRDEPMAAELDKMNTITSEASQWLKEAEAPGSTLPSARVVSGAAPSVDDTEPVTAGHSANEIKPSKIDDFASVQDQFLEGVAPKILNPKLAQGTYKLSVRGVGGIIYSKKTNTPIAAAEHLTARRVKAADKVIRSKAKFQDDLALPESARSVAAYAGYTDRFDHGHMIPAGDSPSQPSNTATFRSSNIVPQDVWHNERLWEGIESAVRTMARNGDDLYVVTGPAFIGPKVESISDEAGHQVLVPTNIWKAVYDKTTGEAAVYWTENKKGSERNDFSGSYQVLSIAEFTQRTGIDPFPKLSAAQKQRAMELPPPETPRFRERKHDPESGLTPVSNPVKEDGDADGPH